MRILFTLFIFLITYNGVAQLVVTANNSATALVNAIVGSGITVSGVSMNCPNGASGTFTGGSGNLQIPAGIVLTTGQVSTISGSGGNTSSTNNGAAGHALIASSLDACSITFTIVPTCSTLSIQFVFGSEEYPTWVGSSFNDAFGFFVSGPNPGGGNYTNYNMATIPGTSTPISINNVNAGSNSAYYINNGSGPLVTYNGLTTAITASINVTPCEPYTMTIVIADRGDRFLDSGVFLQNGGLNCSTNPVLTVSPNTSICPGQSATLTATGGTGHTWSPSTGLNTTTGATVIASPTTTTTYTVTANAPCPVTATTTVTVNPAPTITVNNPTICSGQSATLTASGATTYTWFQGATQIGTGASINVSPTATTSYTVQGANATGCPGIATSTVTVNPVATANAGPNQTICAGQSVTLAGSFGGSATSATWSAPAGTGTFSSTTNMGATFTPSITSGTVTLTLTTNDPAGPCPAVTSQMTVTVNPNPTSTFTYNGNQCLTGNNYVFTNTGTVAATHAWNFGNGNTSSATSPSHTYAAAGTYTVTHTVTVGTCVSTTTQNVTVFPMPTSTITGNNPLCNGASSGSVNLSPSGGNAPYSFSWSNGAISEDLSNVPAGTYNVTIFTVNGCQSTNTFTLTNPPVLTTTATGVNASCAGVCNGSATANPTGGTGAYTYAWSNGANTPTANSLCAGTHSVVVSDVNNCTANASFTVNNAGAVTATTSTGNANCGTASGSASVTPSGGTGPYTYLWTPFGQTTQTINLITSGSYGVTVTDFNGCTATATANVIDNAGPTVTIPTTTNVSCFGGNNGTATANATGGTGTLTYAWTPTGGSAATGSGMIANTLYTVTVTDANNCQATATTTLTQPTQVTVTTSSAPSNCGQADGSVSSTGNGGTGILTYVWENSSAVNVGNTATVSNLIAGTYTVTVTDANGCIASSTATISDNSAGTIATTQNNITCFNANNGSATATVTGGTLPITYSWSNGQIGATASNLTPGNHTVSATDGVGCILSAMVTITEPNELVATISDFADVSCFGYTDGNATVTVVGGTGPYTYLWSDAMAQNQPNATNLSPGGYSVTITDFNNCQTSASVTINEPVQLLLDGSDVDAHCNLPDGSATVSVVSGGVAPFSYSWSASPSTTATAGGLAPGSITATVTDNNGCFNSINITVGNIPASTATITNVVHPLCQNDCNGTASVSMSGTGTTPYTYVWSNGNTNQNATGFCDGPISVTVTDANGCISTANSAMIEPDVLNVEVIQFSQPTCFGVCDGILQAQISGGTTPYTILWNDPLQQNAVNAVNLCGDGTVYNVSIVDANGCQIAKGGFLVEPTQVTMSSSVTAANCGQADGEACVTLSGGTAPYTVSWPFNGSTGNCISNIAANTYIVNGLDDNGCAAQLSVTVADLAGPVASISNSQNVSCFAGNNGFATAEIQGGTSPYTYAWDANAGSQTTPTASNLAAGTYTLSITDNNGCIASTSVVITQPNEFVVQGVTTNPTCFGYTDGSIVYTLMGGTAPYSFSWNDPSNQTTNTASGLSAGTYTVTVTDQNNCSTFNTYTLIDPQQFNASISNTPLLCTGDFSGTATANYFNNNGNVTYQWNDANNQSTQTATGLAAGTYGVTLTDGAGCIATATTTISEPTLLTGMIDLVNNVTCFGLSNGFANAAVSGGTAPYTFLWSNGVTTPTITNVSAGNYFVDITDANGCQIDLSAQISQPTQLTGSIIATNVSCYGGQNGAANLSVAGGISPYTFQWNDLNFQTSQNASNLFAGNYLVTITDDNNCQLNVNTTITQPNQMVANVTVNSSNCGQNNGSVCVNIAGGVLPYQFTWNDPLQQTSACALNLLAGTYTISVTDANNCVYDSIININDVAGPNITFNGGVNPSCNGLTNGSLSMTVGGGTLPYQTYAWTTAQGNAVGAINNPELTNIGHGCYTLTVIDDAGCQASNTQCVTQPNALNSAITSTQHVTCYLGCNGQTTVSIAGGTVPYSIAWNNLTTDATNTNLCAGTYVANITDGNGCTSQSTVNITEPAQLISSVNNVTNVSCFGFNDGQISIGITGGTAPYLHSWTPLVSSTTLGTNLSAGNYTILSTDANGCTTEISAAISSPQPLNGSLVVTDATCGTCNGQVTFVAEGGTLPYSYLWNNGQPSVTATNVCAGIFGGTVSDANGCTFTTTTSVFNIPGPSISQVAFTSPTCNGLSNGSATPIFTGGTAPFSYLWTNNNQTAETAVALPAGTHCVNITDANGCVATSCAVVTQPSPLTAIPDGSTTICYGGQTQIWASGSGGTTPYTINWQGANTSGFVGQGPILVNPTNTSTYCFTVSDNNGCLSPQACVQITVTPALNATLPADVNICTGDDIELIGTYTGGNGNPYTYSWHQGAVNTPSIGNQTSLTVNPSGQTTYFVVLTDGCSLPDTAQITVGLHPLPVSFINVLNPNECAPGTINFISNSDIGVNFNWDFQCDGNSDFTTTGSTATYTYSSPGVYSICLTSISADGCSSTVSLIDGVEIYPVPVANFTFDPLTTTMTNPYVHVSSTSVGAYQWLWDFGSNGSVDAITENANFEFIEAGTYNVTLTVINEFGCEHAVTYPYTVLPVQNIYVPNAFTPDGDGNNDFFFVDGIGLDRDHFDLYIFNRWGDLIWEAHNPDLKWDGKHNNELVQQDVYVWLLKTRDIDGRTVSLRGHVTVLR
jgi:gliding motility-associated-like protein